jgi:uncharacterized membrane protein
MYHINNGTLLVIFIGLITIALAYLSSTSASITSRQLTEPETADLNAAVEQGRNQIIGAVIGVLVGVTLIGLGYWFFIKRVTAAKVRAAEEAHG